MVADACFQSSETREELAGGHGPTTGAHSSGRAGSIPGLPLAMAPEAPPGQVPHTLPEPRAAQGAGTLPCVAAAALQTKAFPYLPGHLSFLRLWRVLLPHGPMQGSAEAVRPGATRRLGLCREEGGGPRGSQLMARGGAGLGHHLGGPAATALQARGREGLMVGWEAVV